MPLLLLAAVLLAGGSCRGHRGKPNVILIVIDTARQSHFSCYGYSRETTPRADQLAKEGVRFENAVSASPWTLPSMASLLTGLWPHQHLAGYAVQDPDTHQEGLTFLSESAVTLAEVLSRNKYQTVGFFQNPFVDPGFGLKRGFADYDYFPGDNLRIRKATEVVKLATDWLEKSRDPRHPFFMVVHFFDPHLAYDPPSEFMLPFIYGYQGKMVSPFNPSDPEIEKIRMGELKFSEEDRKFIVGLYDAELSFTDNWVGFFMDYLKNKGLYDQSLIILTADHGEEFWDHNSFEHGHTLYQELLLTPLIVRFPGGENAGMAVKERVSLVDVMPSIIAYLGIETPFQGAGRSFISMPGAAIKPANRTIVAELNRSGNPLQAIYSGNFKLILDRLSGNMEIYNLADDPKETKNLFGIKESYPPEIIDQIRGVVSIIRKADQAKTPAKISPEIRAKLKALGYLK